MRTSSSGAEALPWYALRVRSNSEFLANNALQCRGYETFTPSYRVRRRWSDRIKEIEAPLFPGYVFCRLDAERRTPVLQSPGVVEIVGIGKAPAMLEEREIDAIRSIIAAGASAQPCSFFSVGDRVKIGTGPLRGAEGILASIQGRRKFVISVSLLQRSISVEVEESWLLPVN